MNKDEQPVEAVEAVKTEAVVEDIPLNTEQESSGIPQIGYKEYKALKKSKYSENYTKWNKNFLLRHRHTGAVIEIRAVSSCHACNLIGWKPQQVQLLGESTVESKNEQ